MIQVRNVSRQFGSFLALDNLNFSVNRGELVALLGPNGAGKTTTMRIITGFLPPSAGEVTVDGLDVFEESEAVKSVTGYLPENPPLYPELTVREYLAFVAELKRVPKKRIPESVDRCVELCGLTERRNTLIGLLSKGLRQRTGIAQAIVNSPKVLVLDEPTVGLDPVQVVDVRQLIRDLAKKEDRTVILSTHLLAEAEEICEKCVIIQNGKILAQDPIGVLREKTLREMKVRLFVARPDAPLYERLRAIDGVRDVRTAEDGAIELLTERDAREDAARAAVESGAGLLELSRSGHSLEDVFIKLVR